MTVDPSLAALAVLFLVVVALTALATGALRFGADSRPDIDDRDRRPWLVPGTPRVP